MARSANLDRRDGESNRDFEDRVLATMAESSDQHWMSIDGLYDDMVRACDAASDGDPSESQLKLLGVAGRLVVLELARRRAERHVSDRRLRESL
jgi:hypothetical protein